MSWRDLFLNCSPSDEAIAEAIHSTFKVQIDEVQILSEFPNFEKLDSKLQVICTRSQLLGDFPTFLRIYLMKPALFPDNDEHVLSEISNNLGCYGLITSEEYNPFRWILLKNVHTRQQVLIDADKLDNEENMQLKIIEYVDEQNRGY